MNAALSDLSKAFDNVHHATLLQRLIDVGMPVGIVALLAIGGTVVHMPL